MSLRASSVVCGWLTVLIALFTLATALYVTDLVPGLPGPHYLFAVDAVVELARSRVAVPVDSRIALLDARQVVPGPARCASGVIAPREGTDITIERRGDGPVRLVLDGAQGPAGTLERRVAGRDEPATDELPAQAVFWLGPDPGETRTAARCRGAGALRAALQGSLQIGEEASAAARSAARLWPGPAAPQRIGLRMMGRSRLIPVIGEELLHDLGTMTLPPDARIAAGAADTWRISIAPGREGGLSVQATISTPELRVYSRSGPVAGDTIQAGMLAVLFSHPRIGLGAASVAFLWGLATAFDLLGKARDASARGAKS